MSRQKRPSQKALPGSTPASSTRKSARRTPADEQPRLFTVTGSYEGIPEYVAADAAPDRSAASGSEHRTAAAAAAAPLFQSNGHCCDREKTGDGLTDHRIFGPEQLGAVVGHEYRVRACRCRKWFCEGCGPRLGAQLRQRLLERVKTFTDVYGVTLTVDGSLFERPEQAWQYVMDERLLSRLVRELLRRGHLQTKAYFWVVEFQQNTQPHWHVLLDASFVPFEEIVEIWSRYRPPSAPPLEVPVTAENYRGQAPAFGSVRYTPASSKFRAAYYATKYLTKYPATGYPDWVLNRVGRMPRFGHSHRLFPRASTHDPMCFCDECRGDRESGAPPRPPKKPASEARHRRSEPKTIRERVEECGNSCTVVKVQLVEFPDGSLTDGRGRFEGTLKLPYRAACEFLDVSEDEHWQLNLDGETVGQLEGFAKEQELLREGA